MRACLGLAFVAIGLTPISARAQSSDEWLERGDALSASAAPEDLERALDAYVHVAATDPRYTLALERRAWVAFLLDRTAESISLYVALVDRLAPSPPRDQALVMLASMFADLDWDRDGTTDDATPLARLSDPTLVPQDRPWLADLVFATARALYRSSRDPDAIALMAHALSRWPAPSDGNPLAGACRRHRVRPTTLHSESPTDRTLASETCARLGQ